MAKSNDDSTQPNKSNLAKAASAAVAPVRGLGTYIEKHPVRSAAIFASTVVVGGGLLGVGIAASVVSFGVAAPVAIPLGVAAIGAGVAAFTGDAILTNKSEKARKQREAMIKSSMQETALGGPVPAKSQSQSQAAAPAISQPDQKKGMASKIGSKVGSGFQAAGKAALSMVKSAASTTKQIPGKAIDSAKSIGNGIKNFASRNNSGDVPLPERPAQQNLPSARGRDDTIGGHRQRGPSQGSNGR